MGRWKSRLPLERYYDNIHAIDTRKMDSVVSTYVYPTACFGNTEMYYVLAWITWVAN